MKNEREMADRFSLIQKELATLTERHEEKQAAISAVEDLKNEIRGLKLFRSRVYPEFKIEFPEIMGKIGD